MKYDDLTEIARDSKLLTILQGCVNNQYVHGKTKIEDIQAIEQALLDNGLKLLKNYDCLTEIQQEIFKKAVKKYYKQITK